MPLEFEQQRNNNYENLLQNEDGTTVQNYAQFKEYVLNKCNAWRGEYLERFKRGEVVREIAENLRDINSVMKGYFNSNAFNDKEFKEAKNLFNGRYKGVLEHTSYEKKSALYTKVFSMEDVFNFIEKKYPDEKERDKIAQTYVKKTLEGMAKIAEEANKGRNVKTRDERLQKNVDKAIEEYKKANGLDELDQETIDKIKQEELTKLERKVSAEWAKKREQALKEKRSYREEVEDREEEKLDSRISKMTDAMNGRKADLAELHENTLKNIRHSMDHNKKDITRQKMSKFERKQMIAKINHRKDRLATIGEMAEMPSRFDLTGKGFSDTRAIINSSKQALQTSGFSPKDSLFFKMEILHKLNERHESRGFFSRLRFISNMMENNLIKGFKADLRAQGITEEQINEITANGSAFDSAKWEKVATDMYPEVEEDTYSRQDAEFKDSIKEDIIEEEPEEERDMEKVGVSKEKEPELEEKA